MRKAKLGWLRLFIYNPVVLLIVSIFKSPFPIHLYE